MVLLPIFKILWNIFKTIRLFPSLTISYRSNRIYLFLSAKCYKISKLTEINLSYFSCVIFDNYGDVRVTNSFCKIEKKGEKGIGETVEKRMWRVAFKQLSHETALSSSDSSYFTDPLDSLFLPWLFSQFSTISLATSSRIISTKRNGQKIARQPRNSRRPAAESR